MKKTETWLTTIVMALLLCLLVVCGTASAEQVSFGDWSNVGTSEWQEVDGVYSPTTMSQHAYLRLDKPLGNDYTIDFDFKKEDSGFNNVFIGFGIKEGDANLTQSGYSLNLIAGFARVMRYENYGELFGNHYDGDINMNAFHDWTHFQITSANGKDYTITFNDGEERKIEFTDETFPGGHFVIAAYGSTPCNYKDITVTIKAPHQVKGYLNNTVCVTGPAFRDQPDPLTDKWYTCLPLDLSMDGQYTYPLVGGNSYIIGEVTVNVDGDFLKTTYKYYNKSSGGYDTEDLSQYLNFFGDYAAIMASDLENLNESPFKFDRVYSIANDLDGDTEVLMFIVNRVNFWDANRSIGRYNRSKFKDFLDAAQNNLLAMSQDGHIINSPVGVDTASLDESGQFSFADWTNVGTSEWQEFNGTYSAKEMSQHAYLRLDEPLGDNYVIDFDFKKEDAGFNNVFIGFGVKEGDSNLTESGYSLNLVSGFARVMRYENYNELFGNHYDGDINMNVFNDWTHIKIACEDGRDYTIAFNDGQERIIRFTDDTFPGGYFVISAYGSTPCYYKNIQITK